MFPCMTTTYIRHIPSPPLNACYYLDRQKPFRHEKILPVPVLDLKINLSGAYPFLIFPLSELYNQVAPVDAIRGRWVSQIRNSSMLHQV
jgi:hypothetical protein